MKDWDDPYTEPNEDDLTARRVVSLAIILSNANRALATSEIRREIYGELSMSAFRKTFQRDRERLLLAGFVIRNSKKVDDESTWELDAESTFASRNVLTQEDALALDFILLPFASDPSFPYAQDLRMALTKIDRSFDGSSQATLPPEARKRNRNLVRVEQALMARHAVCIRYCRADNSEIERIVAPYGLFFFRGESYLVAARAGKDVVDGEPPHTYNVGRIRSVREMTRMRYEIPADFDVRDYKKLPFQMGDIRYKATLLVPHCRTQELYARYSCHGTWSHDENATLLSVDVSDEDVAAAWAIAEEVRPLEPHSLVQTWRERLLRMAKGGE